MYQHLALETICHQIKLLRRDPKLVINPDPVLNAQAFLTYVVPQAVFQPETENPET